MMKFNEFVCVPQLRFEKTLLYTFNNALCKTQEKLQVEVFNIVCGVRGEVKEVFVWCVS